MDDIETFLLLLLTVLLVMLDGLFAAAIFSALRARGTRIKEMAEGGSFSAKMASAALNDLHGWLATAQFGLTLTTLALGWLSVPLVADRLVVPALEASGFVRYAQSGSLTVAGIAFTLIAFAVCIFSALAPRMVALRRPEDVLLRVAPAMALFHWLFTPFSLLLSGVARVMLRLTGLPVTDDQQQAHSEEELRKIISASGAENGGTLCEMQAELLDNIIDFGRRSARQVMTHRTEILALDAEVPLAENVRLAQDGGRTRYPVIQGDIDTVIGFVHTKDLFALYQQNPQGDIRGVAREIMLVPDTIRGDQILRQMQRKRQHMAVLVDEYGGTAGLVTITDLLEELVGEWPDEFEPVEEEWLIQLDETTWRVDGRLPFVDLEEAIGRALPCEESCDTVGGYAFWLFGRIPVVGDTAQADGVAVYIAEMDSRRVSHVEITVIETGEDEEQNGGNDYHQREHGMAAPPQHR